MKLDLGEAANLGDTPVLAVGAAPKEFLRSLPDCLLPLDLCPWCDKCAFLLVLVDSHGLSRSAEIVACNALPEGAQIAVMRALVGRMLLCNAA